MSSASEIRVKNRELLKVCGFDNGFTGLNYCNEKKKSANLENTAPILIIK
jgi:hypothetical protein